MLNKKILDLLNLLLEQKKQEKDTFRIRAIQNAIKVIKGLDFEITNADQIKGMTGIGKGIYDRVVEILKTGKLEQIQQAQQEYEIEKELSNVVGIGPVKAKELYKQGIHTVEELKKEHTKGNIKLNDTQILGLKYYEDLKERIPRSEITKFKNVLKKLKMKVEFDIVGSYRRKKKDSGDIDVLFKGDINLKDLVNILKEKDILIDDISMGKLKYMGFGKINKYARRIDFLLIPEEEYYTALVYFTGSAEFNTNMRQIAKDKGYKLNEHGLYKGKERISINSEKELFDILGMEYIEPEKR
jgi:DNA polymerase/3'-5' exonuclease PolX